MSMHDEDDDFVPDEPTVGTFTDLSTAVMVPPKWIIKDLLPVGLTFIAGPPKSEKSTLTMAISLLSAGAACKALPPFLSEVENGGPVMMFSYEATAGELRHMAEEGLKCAVPGDESILIADDPWKFRLDDPDGISTLLHWLRMKDPRICILDPLRDFHQQEEKDSGAMNRMLRPIRQWAVEHDSSLIIVHHTKKKDDDSRPTYGTNDLRGTSALFGIADCVLVLTPFKDRSVSIDATFKRAKAWQRNITFAAYDRAGQNAVEVMSEVDIMVLGGITNGAQDVDQLGSQIKVAPNLLKDSLSRLARNGLIRRNGQAWERVQ